MKNALDDPVYHRMHMNVMSHLAAAVLEMPDDDHHDHLMAALMRCEDTREIVGDRVRVLVRGEVITEFPLSDLIQAVDDSWLQQIPE
jgi:hypothetical protein